MEPIGKSDQLLGAISRLEETGLCAGDYFLVFKHSSNMNQRKEHHCNWRACFPNYTAFVLSLVLVVGWAHAVCHDQ